MFKQLLTLTLLVTPFTVKAADVLNTTPQTVAIQNTVERTTLMRHASDWQLTPYEWTTYQQLMQGPSGHWYPQLTPPEVLGINAKTAQEQQHFAAIVAQEEHAKVVRELAFDKAVHQALASLYPNEPVINAFDASSFNPLNHKKPDASLALQSGDHLVLFSDVLMPIDFLALPRLLSAITHNPGVVLDIYGVNSKDDASIREWARLNRIPMDFVQSGRITLNQDHGQMLKTVGKVALPTVILVRNHQSQTVALGSLS